MTDRWDRYFLDLALRSAAMSKDPRTQVGAVLVGPDREVRGTGFNGFPRGIADTAERLNDRDLKLRLMVHAERNVILNCARVGIPTKGCTLYFAATDHTGNVWGGAPCCACAIEIVQAGIATVVSPPFKIAPSHWREDIEFAGTVLAEAGVGYRELT